MNRRIEEIIYTLHRPFCYEDFSKLIVSGQQVSIPYGTLRNKISERKAKGLVIDAYKIGKKKYYSLPAEIFDKPKRITDYRMVGPTCHPIFKELRNIRMGPPALHNIRLRFETPGIWSQFHYAGYESKPYNHDIKIPSRHFDSLTISISIHRSDTVSIIIGCSEIPIAADIYGVIRLSNALCITREYISQIIDKYGGFNIPPCYEWIITMWHFGVDSVSEYAGEKFECTWQLAEGILVRLYSKEFSNKKRHVRFDKQEYPKIKLAEIISDILFPSGELV